jgi:hypothetical protein
MCMCWTIGCVHCSFYPWPRSLVDQTQKITKCVVGSLLQEFFLNHTNIAKNLLHLVQMALMFSVLSLV